MVLVIITSAGEGEKKRRRRRRRQIDRESAPTYAPGEKSADQDSGLRVVVRDLLDFGECAENVEASQPRRDSSHGARAFPDDTLTLPGVALAEVLRRARSDGRHSPGEKR